MPKLPVISGKELITALKKVGFVEVRQKGSHISLQKTGLSRDDLLELS
ncbi:HicA toxin of bacterial toxin-antitoxin [uncultured archaeon]|nr:HicA toxin of bacterial toxin-antitoxin [uncultured archaeon]